MRLSPRSPAPIPPIKKAGPVLLQKASAREALSLSHFLFRTSSAAVIAPAGYPEISPTIKAEASSPLIPNIAPKGFRRNFPIASAAPDAVIYDDRTRNGNRDGITVDTHTLSAEETASAAVFDIIISIGAAKSGKNGMICRNDCNSAFAFFLMIPLPAELRMTFVLFILITPHKLYCIHSIFSEITEDYITDEKTVSKGVGGLI